MRAGKSWPWIIPIFAQTIWPPSGRQLLLRDFLRCDKRVFHGSLRGMLNLFIGFLAAALTAGPQAAVTNAVSPVKAATNNPVEQEYRKLLEMDDTSQGEVDHMIKEEQKFKEKGGGQEAALKARVLQTLDPVKKAYEDFLKRNPNHVDARVAYGSFLNDIGE